MKYSHLFLFFASVFTSFFGTQLNFNEENTNSVEGTWKIIEVQTVKKDGTITSIFPTESIAIFSRNYYSFSWTSDTTKVNNWVIEDEVKLRRFNTSIVNAGTYQQDDSVLITNALFAMHPMFTYGTARFRFKLDSDTLVLTGQSVVSAGHILHPVYASGSYIVSKLLRIK